MKQGINLLIVCVVALGLQACGCGRTVVLEPVECSKSITGLTISAKKSTTEMPAEMQASFEGMLKEKLYKEGGFKENKDMTLLYRFIQLDEGSQFGRWFFGGLGNAGEGTLTVEVRYLDCSGKEMGKIQAEGKIGSGVLGGSFTHALEQAVNQIADYTFKTFKKGS